VNKNGSKISIAKIAIFCYNWFVVKILEEKMNISLTNELEEFINRKVQSGFYQTSSEVVREALRLLVDKDEVYQRKLVALNYKIQEGLDDLDCGNVKSGDEVYSNIKFGSNEQF
jgi:antitoxin ParD1/3/4